MKFKLSKIHVALIAVGFGSVLCATTYAQTANSFPVVVPVNQASIYGAVSVLWAKPTNDDLYYAMSGTRASTGSRTFHAIDPDYCVGWRLDAGYLLPCTGNDISANWTYFSSDDDCTTTKPGDADLHSRYLSESDWDRVTSDVCFDFNEINLEIGQKVDFCALHTRFHFGLSYVCLEHDFDTRATASDSGDGGGRGSDSGGGRGNGDGDGSSATGRAHLESDFWGIGPRFGVDIAYPLGGSCSPVSLVGHAAGALLAGEIEVKENSTVNIRGSRSSSVKTLRTRSDDICTVLPTIMLKLGLKYSSNPDPGCGGYAVEAGYQTSSFSHSINHGHDFDKAHRTGIINPISNFGIYGWYLTLSYAG